MTSSGHPPSITAPEARGAKAPAALVSLDPVVPQVGNCRTLYVVCCMLYGLGGGQSNTRHACGERAGIPLVLVALRLNVHLI